MRIAIVHSFYRGSTPSGENQIVLNHVRELQQAGIEVCLVRRDTPDSGLWQRSIHSARAAIHQLAGLDAQIADELDAIQPDIVHVHNLFPNFGWRWMEKFRGRIISHVHNYRFQCIRGTMFRDGAICQECVNTSPLKGLQYRCYHDSFIQSIPPTRLATKHICEHPYFMHSSALVVGSTLGLQQVLNAGAPRDQVHLIPNFSPQQPRLAPGEFDTRTWAFAGRLTQEKGILQLLEILPRTARIKVFGSGPLEGEIASAASSNVLLQGQLQHAELQRALRTCVGLIIPSLWYEMNPFVSAEAFSRAQPVVAFADNSVGMELDAIDPNLVYRQAADLDHSLAYTLRNFSDVQRNLEDHYNRHYSRGSWLRETLALYEKVRS